MGPVLPCAFPLFVFAASAGAAKAAISDAERTPAQLAECYGRRYEDLNRRYCASPGVCAFHPEVLFFMICDLLRGHELAGRSPMAR